MSATIEAMSKLCWSLPLHGIELRVHDGPTPHDQPIEIWVGETPSFLSVDDAEGLRVALGRALLEARTRRDGS